MKRITRIILLCTIATAFALTLAGCSGETTGSGDSQELISRDFFAMDTYMTVSAYGEGADAALQDVETMIQDLEQEVSTEETGSAIARLNAEGSGVLSGDSLTLVSRALELYEETDGAFNISIYPIMKAWGFTTKDYRVPDGAELSKLLEKTDLSTVDFDAQTGAIRFGQEGMEIDLGGITKGLASSKSVDIFSAAGLAGGLVNLGGNVQTYGTKPDGSLWKIAVQSPYESDEYLGVIELTDKAVITSGGYERYFEQDGVTYHHIMDPATGYPARNGLISVTIVTDDGTLGDGLSTSLFVMGKEKAIDFWRAHRDTFDCILMDEDNRLYVSQPIADSFTSDKYEVEVIQ